MLRSVGISVSPCEDAATLGYDDRQINRIVIRIAQYFLDKDMRVIFGHDWREDGVMRGGGQFRKRRREPNSGGGGRPVGVRAR